jgi:hypothetical protein
VRALQSVRLPVLAALILQQLVLHPLQEPHAALLLPEVAQAEAQTLLIFNFAHANYFVVQQVAVDEQEVAAWLEVALEKTLLLVGLLLANQAQAVLFYLVV